MKPSKLLYSSDSPEWVMRIIGVSLVRPAAAPQTGARYTFLSLFLGAELAGELFSATAAIVSVLSSSRNQTLDSPASSVLPRRDLEGRQSSDISHGTATSQILDSSISLDESLRHGISNDSASDEEDSELEGVTNKKRRRCVLCMGPRRATSATSCGHLFCWDCIIGWCQASDSGSAECPLCRQQITPQSVLRLHWY